MSGKDMGRRRRWDDFFADPCPRHMNSFGYDRLLVHLGYIFGAQPQRWFTLVLTARRESLVVSSYWICSLKRFLASRARCELVQRFIVSGR